MGSPHRGLNKNFKNQQKLILPDVSYARDLQALSTCALFLVLVLKRCHLFSFHKWANSLLFLILGIRRPVNNQQRFVRQPNLQIRYDSFITIFLEIMVIYGDIYIHQKVTSVHFYSNSQQHWISIRIDDHNYWILRLCLSRNLHL